MFSKVLVYHLRTRYPQCQITHLTDQLLDMGITPKSLKTSPETIRIINLQQRPVPEIDLTLNDNIIQITVSVGDYSTHYTTIDLQSPDSITTLENKLDYVTSLRDVRQVFKR